MAQTHPTPRLTDAYPGATLPPATTPKRRKRRKMSKRGKPVPGHAGVFDNFDGTFTIRAIAKKDGKRRESQEVFRGPLTRAVLRQAELKLLGEAELEKRIRKPACYATMADAATAWLQHRRATGKGLKSTVDTFDRHVRAFITPYFGTMKVEDVGPAEINAWMSWLGEQRSRRGKPLAKEYLAGAWRTLRILLKHVCAEARIVSPADGVDFSVVGKEARKKTWLSQEDVGRWVTALSHEPPRYRALLGLLVTTGARFGEITALRRSDFAEGANGFRLVRSQSAGVVNASTKTSRERDVPLLPWVGLSVGLWLTEVPEAPDTLLFVSRSGKLLQSASIRKPMDRVKARAGLPMHITPHDLRRTIGNLVRRAAGKEVAMSLLGHVTDAMHTHYSQVEADERLAAVMTALGSAATGGNTGGTAPAPIQWA